MHHLYSQVQVKSSRRFHGKYLRGFPLATEATPHPEEVRRLSLGQNHGGRAWGTLTLEEKHKKARGKVSRNVTKLSVA